MNERALRLPPLSRLRPFEAAARLESFTRAAAELSMTQTAVSKQIAQLERDLGVRLFERRNRGVFLTDEGRRFGLVVSSALSSIAAETARLRGECRARELVLHCQLCEAFYWLMPRLANFHERHPGIELRVVTSLRPLTEAVGGFDVAIQTSGRPSGSARLAFTASDEVFPVCAPRLVDGRTLPMALEELCTLPLLAHQVVPQDWIDWPAWYRAVGAELPGDVRLVEFDSFPLVLQAAAAGQGLALGWRRTVESQLAEGKLVTPCVESLRRPTELAVFRMPGHGRHPRVDDLLNWLAEAFADPGASCTATPVARATKSPCG